MAQFEREAKLLASLNHPNIAAIYGLEEAEGFLYLKSKKSGGKLSGSSLRFQNQVSIEIP